MRYLIDTNAVICMLKNRFGIREQMKIHGLENCYVSEITLAELYYGISKSENPKHRNEVDLVKDMFKVVPIMSSLEMYGHQKYKLEKLGLPIDDFDILIGVTAIVNDMTLVTHNTKHFDRIEGLRLIDWEKR